LSVTRIKGSENVHSLNAKVLTMPIGGEDKHGRPRIGGVLVPHEGAASQVNTTPLAVSEEDVEAIRLLAESGGYSQKKIAEELGITEYRVKKALGRPV
jgi:DNA-binding NarL/FixJ family response regulator